MAQQRMSESDLQRMGVELIPGTTDQYRKKKTVKQPREVLYINKNTIMNSSHSFTSKAILMQRVEVKPMSVNLAWQGQRFKTDDYKSYEQGVLSMLQPSHLPVSPYKLSLTFAVSNKASDIDNPVKLFIDILQKKYQFNDKEIYELSVKKIIVPKRKEYCEFKLEHLE